MDSKLVKLVTALNAARARNQKAKIGTSCVCPSCGTGFIKKTYQQVFCKSKSKTECKDRYWNTVDESKRNNQDRLSLSRVVWLFEKEMEDLI